MNREWRDGSVELVDGYVLRNARGDFAGRVEGVRFALEGGFVNVKVPGVAETQVVSAPAVRLIRCEPTDAAGGASNR